MKRFSYTLRLCLSLFFVPLWANAANVTVSSQEPSQVYEYQLDNGLTLWVKPDHRAPTATHMIWYRVGSMDEVDGTSGVAHMLEHMLFRGTKAVPDGGFSRRVAELGGEDNAFTSYDMTAYYQQIPNQALPEVMRMEADRMTNATFNPDHFLKELEVVKEERRMRTDENPRAQLWERLQATMYMADPYHRPVIGWMSDLDAMTVEDAKAFYQYWYRPDNAAVIIVGDVDPQETFELAQQTYGAIPKPQEVLVPAKPRIEPTQNGIRRIEHKAPASQSYVILSFKVPGLLDWDGEDVLSQDVYALTMLSAVLDGSTSARLERSLVQGERGARIADSVAASYGLSARGPVSFTLMGAPAEGFTPEALEAALRDEVARVARDGVDPKELERIKIQWIASRIYQNDSQMSQAEDLGSNWILGFPPQATDRLLERLREVTPEQVQSVAARYFGDDQLTVGILRAQPLDADEQSSIQDAN